MVLKVTMLVMFCLQRCGMGNRKSNSKGRSTLGGKHIRIDKYIKESLAWGSLSPEAKALYFEIKYLFNGHNNGCIGLSLKKAGELSNMRRKRVEKAFDDLLQKGFIKRTRQGLFHKGLASEYALTEYELNGKKATKDFMYWKPKK